MCLPAMSAMPSPHGLPRPTAATTSGLRLRRLPGTQVTEPALTIAWSELGLLLEAGVFMAVNIRLGGRQNIGQVDDLSCAGWPHFLPMCSRRS
jgi:hypothetical protein